MCRSSYLKKYSSPPETTVVGHERVPTQKNVMLLQSRSSVSSICSHVDCWVLRLTDAMGRAPGSGPCCSSRADVDRAQANALTCSLLCFQNTSVMQDPEKTNVHVTCARAQARARARTHACFESNVFRVRPHGEKWALPISMRWNILWGPDTISSHGLIS